MWKIKCIFRTKTHILSINCWSEELFSHTVLHMHIFLNLHFINLKGFSPVFFEIYLCSDVTSWHGKLRHFFPSQSFSQFHLMTMFVWITSSLLPSNNSPKHRNTNSKEKLFSGKTAFIHLLYSWFYCDGSNQGFKYTVARNILHVCFKLGAWDLSFTSKMIKMS